MKSMKLSNWDKPSIANDLKKLDRKRKREYIKKGKTLKYYQLKKDFDQLYKKEARKILEKNILLIYHQIAKFESCLLTYCAKVKQNVYDLLINFY